MTYVDPQGPHPEHVVEVRREGGTTGWFVAGIVAIVAVIAVAFMLTVGSRTPAEDQLVQAQEQGRAVGVIEGAQTGAAQATIVAQQAAPAARPRPAPPTPRRPPTTPPLAPPPRATTPWPRRPTPTSSNRRRSR